MKRVSSGLLRSFAGDWLQEIANAETGTPIIKLRAMNKVFKGADVESLPALLRSLRWCKAMVVAWIPHDLEQLVHELQSLTTASFAQKRSDVAVALAVVV